VGLAPADLSFDRRDTDAAANSDRIGHVLSSSVAALLWGSEIRICDVDLQ
jgi:hypothetical protein